MPLVGQVKSYIYLGHGADVSLVNNKSVPKGSTLSTIAEAGIAAIGAGPGIASLIGAGGIHTRHIAAHEGGGHRPIVAGAGIAAIRASPTLSVRMIDAIDFARSPGASEKEEEDQHKTLRCDGKPVLRAKR